jgi:cell division protein FtsA
MDTRIGYPNEHLAGDSDEEIASPLYATAVGLLMNAVQNKAKVREARQETMDKDEEHDVFTGEDNTQTKTALKKERKSIFDKWSEKLKDFLDNAE